MTEGASAATTSPTAREEFRYGPSGARYLRTSTWQPPAGSLGGTATRRARTFHAGGFEETHVAAGDRTSVITRTRVTDNVVHVSERHRSGDQLAAGAEGFEYPHRDHLGSVEAVSAAGPVLALAHDPYGARRAADWSRALAAPESAALSDVQPRGFTGHEHLDRVGLIHANGRLYDPRLGRYLSPDAAVSDPTSSQDWNGYSYVANSPLSFTDPTGMVRAGPGCNVGGVMCLDNGGGHADSPATYPEPYSVRVTIPVVTPFSVWGGGAFWGGGLPGERGFGGAFGWFGGYTVSHASINVSGVVDRSTGVGTRGPGDRPMAETVARWALDFFVLDTVHAAAETVADVRAGNYGGAAVGAALVLCDVVKGCKLLTKIPGAERVVNWLKQRVRKPAADIEDIIVIGRTKDLTNLRPGERTLLDLLPDQGNPRANWRQNSGVLRREMSKVDHIRDATLDKHGKPLPSKRSKFIDAERNLLKNHGWKHDKVTGYWER